MSTGDFPERFRQATLRRDDLRDEAAIGEMILETRPQCICIMYNAYVVAILCVYIMYVYIHMYICIYIYRERERENSEPTAEKDEAAGGSVREPLVGPASR